MSYPQGYLYQPSASLALYSCPAYSTSVISGPRTDELGRSSSGSAFSPYAGSTAFTAPSPGYNSHLQYGTDPAAAAAAAFTSYVVRAAPGSRHRAGHGGIPRASVPDPSRACFLQRSGAARPGRLGPAGCPPRSGRGGEGRVPPPLSAPSPRCPLALPRLHLGEKRWLAARRPVASWGRSLPARGPPGPSARSPGKERGEKPGRARRRRRGGGPRAGPGAALVVSLLSRSRPDLAPPGRCPLSSQGSPYDHTPGMAGSLGYHPYAAPLGSYPYGDPAYRKNATRDATATLKAWLNEHRKNPYPTKGEKIMLAIITKMTLTQCPFPNGAVLPRPLYYTAPFYPGYTNYGSFGALHGHPAGGPAAAAPGAHFNGLNQTVLSRAESLAKDTKMIRSQSQVDLCKDSPYELKKGMSNI
ncbi:IRX5 protein, partial [Rhynochetos jubatus]|nr:IRX5 protein [Rhynochetos jubatus]